MIVFVRTGCSEHGHPEEEEQAEVVALAQHCRQRLGTMRSRALEITVAGRRRHHLVNGCLGLLRLSADTGRGEPGACSVVHR